jgi:hypothetical protein
LWGSAKSLSAEPPASCVKLESIEDKPMNAITAVLSIFAAAAAITLAITAFVNA